MMASPLQVILLYVVMIVVVGTPALACESDGGENRNIAGSSDMVWPVTNPLAWVVRLSITYINDPQDYVCSGSMTRGLWSTYQSGRVLTFLTAAHCLYGIYDFTTGTQKTINTLQVTVNGVTSAVEDYDPNTMTGACRGTWSPSWTNVANRGAVTPSLVAQFDYAVIICFPDLMATPAQFTPLYNIGFGMQADTATMNNNVAYSYGYSTIPPPGGNSNSLLVLSIPPANPQKWVISQDVYGQYLDITPSNIQNAQSGSSIVRQETIEGSINYFQVGIVSGDNGATTPQQCQNLAHRFIPGTMAELSHLFQLAYLGGTTANPEFAIGSNNFGGPPYSVFGVQNGALSTAPLQTPTDNTQLWGFGLLRSASSNIGVYQTTKSIYNLANLIITDPTRPTSPWNVYVMQFSPSGCPSSGQPVEGGCGAIIVEQLIPGTFNSVYDPLIQFNWPPVYQTGSPTTIIISPYSMSGSYFIRYCNPADYNLQVGQADVCGTLYTSGFNPQLWV